MENRPLVWIVLAFIGGTLLAAYGVLPGLWLPLVVVALGVLLAFASPQRRAARMLSILLMFAGGGGLLWSARHAGAPGDAFSQLALDESGRAIVVEGRVRRPGLFLQGAPSSPDKQGQDGRDKAAALEDHYLTFILDADHAYFRGVSVPLEGRCYVRWSEANTPLFSDERVRVTGKLYPNTGHVNFGIQDLEDHLQRQNVHSLIRAWGKKSVMRLEAGRWWSLPNWASRIRSAQAQRMCEVVPPSVLPFVFTVWLGDRSRLSHREYQSYIESGTAHILAVSGIHMGILFLSALALLRIVVSRRPRALILMAAMITFALTAGARTSAIRAAIMIVIYLVSDVFERDPDPPTALSIAALLFLLINPDALFETGFLLSFLSVGSILLFATPLREKLAGLPRLVEEPLGATLSAQILPLPLAVHFFHVVPLMGPLANLLVVPLLSIVLWLCVLTSLALMVSTQAALLFGHALLPAVGAIHAIVNLIANSSLSHVRLTSPTLLAVSLYLAAFLLIRFRPDWLRPRMRAGAVALLFVGVVVFWRPWREPPMIAFLDVGHGDATFLRSPGGQTLLIDGGDKSDYVNLGRRVVAPFLWSHGVSHLDYVLGTHPDRDHIGGLQYVLGHFRVGQLVLWPGSGHDEPLEHELLAEAARNGVAVRRLHRGQRLVMEGFRVEVLHPPGDWPKTRSDNDQSVVLRVNWGGVRVLLPADAEAPSEHALIRGDCRAEVLKVGHHGSDTSSTGAFLDAVRPRVGIVSTGYKSGRRPVAEEVARRYAARHIPLWRTDLAGGMILSVREGRASLESARRNRGYPCVAPGSGVP